MVESQSSSVHVHVGSLPVNSDGTTTSGTNRRERSFSIDSLRRSNTSLQSPTRTLHLDELEALHRSNSNPRPSSIHSLRSRSNQRNRTPNRHESPLDPDAFRSVEPDVQPIEHARITIRPRVGALRGTFYPRSIEESRQNATPKSTRQGPSHRKIRRWNNDHFNKLAAELQSHRAAEALRNAHEDAHLYRDIINPGDSRGVMHNFLIDEKLKQARDLFYAGDLMPTTIQPTKNTTRRARDDSNLSAEDCMNRIDQRIRRVMIKACMNSYPAVKVVETLEEYVVATFLLELGEFRGSSEWWKDLLIREPEISFHSDSRLIINFHFDAANSTGGFHRILLHAIAQFHGLIAVSKMSNTIKARVLTISGSIKEDRHRLLDQVRCREE